MSNKSLVLISFALIAMLLLTLLVSSCGKREDINDHPGLFVAEQRAEVDYPLVSTENQGITLTVKTAVAGYDSIMLSIDFVGLENVREEYDHDSSRTIIWQPIIELNMMNLILENGKVLPYETRQSWDENMGSSYISYNNKNNDGSYTVVFEIPGIIEKTQQVKLKVNKILDSYGEWNVEFKLTYRPSKVYMVNQEYDFFGNKLLIKNVIIDAFSTQIEYILTDNTGDNALFPYYKYDIRFHYDKLPSELRKRSRGYSHGATGHKVLLSNGEKGYKYISEVPILDDAILSITIGLQPGLNNANYEYTLNLTDFRSK